MKKIIVMIIVAAFTNTIFIGKASAKVAKASSKSKAISAIIGEPTIVDSFEPASDNNTINIKALSNFKTNFEGALNEKWFITTDGFIAKFSLANNLTRASYDQKGNWKYTLQQYNEENLPADIRKLVRSNYYDFAITLVEDIDLLNHGKYYLVHMQDATSWMNVLVHENEITVMEVLNKS